jgi:hypothetical protein
MAPFALIGAVIAVTLLTAKVRGPVGVKLAPYHLSYGIRLPDGPIQQHGDCHLRAGPVGVTHRRTLIWSGRVAGFG